ncbi:PREDICTED: 65-kDa microtubule-associated protein 5-like [Camelina sativa]|uniref:65-kDa microtubule-associated protein 5-like n=1 Tax=Camelina sativa TaxID=90675 RepID=A0ABM0ZKY6_CAMSA|nr:PREDICTED: 65-kDa microtubule-associated protein 5-like [Camelina sativa]
MVEMCPSSTVTSTYLLQITWDEIGESYSDRDKMLLELEQECLHIYNKMLEEIPKYRAELQRSLAQAQAEIASVMPALGEKVSFPRKGGSLKEQISTVKPVSEDLLMKKDLPRKELSETLTQIAKISSNVAGNDYPVSSGPQIDESDLTQRKLDELRAHLQVLRNEKAVRLQKVNSYISAVHELSEIMSFDSSKALSSVHSSLTEFSKTHSKSISNDTLARLTKLVKSLKEEKHERLIKLQGLGRSMQELWNLMETPMDERRRFDHCSDLLSGPADDALKKGCLGLDIILEAEDEVKRLNALKSSKMRELVFKRQCELGEIYRGNHTDINSDAARKSLVKAVYLRHVPCNIDGTKDDSGLLVSSSTAFKPVSYSRRTPGHILGSSRHSGNLESEWSESSLSGKECDYDSSEEEGESCESESSESTCSDRKLGESWLSETESIDSGPSEEEEGNTFVMKGVRRSLVLRKLTREFRRLLKTEIAETITQETAESLLGRKRYRYVLKTKPSSCLRLSDNGTILIVFYETEKLPSKYLLLEESGVRLKNALGWIWDQGQHDDCWTFTTSDLISASLVLHGWEEKYVPLSTGYLLQNVNPKKNALRFINEEYHRCYGEDLEWGLAYVRKFGIPRERMVGFVYD